MSSPEREQLRRQRSVRSGWGVVRSERLDAISSIGARSILDVGCSSGEYVAALAAGGHAAIGVDLLEDEGWTSVSAPFSVADASALPLGDASVDAVVAFETLEHVVDWRSALAEWRRVARNHVVLSVPNTEEPPWAASSGLTYYHWVDRTHVNFFDPRSLHRAIEDAGLAVVRIQPILPVHPWVGVLDAIGLPDRLAAGVGRRLTRFSRRKYHSSLLAIATPA